MNKYEALKFAAIQHSDQWRTVSTGPKIPYVVHLMGVMDRLEKAGCSDHTLVVGALHDVVEDTPTTIQQVEFLWGGDVARDVGDLTLPPHINGKSDPAGKRKYQLDQVRVMSVFAANVKIADKTDNVDSLVRFSPGWGMKATLEYIVSAEDVVQEISRMWKVWDTDPGHSMRELVLGFRDTALNARQHFRFSERIYPEVL